MVTFRTARWRAGFLALLLGAAGDAFPPGAAMLCGTLSAIGGVRPAANFSMTLRDPVLGRSMSHAYRVASLPITG
jgi:hypothetical protein